MTPKIEIFMKCRVSSDFRKSDLSERSAHLGGPAGGSALERASLPMAGEKKEIERDVCLKDWCYLNAWKREQQDKHVLV